MARPKHMDPAVDRDCIRAVASPADQTLQTRDSMANRRRLAEWVATSVMPHEAAVRHALGRSGIASDDLDDIVQEAYCRLAVLKSIDHIERPDSYFYVVARSVAVQRLRQRRVVQLEAVAEIESIADSERPSPERQVAGRRDWDRVVAIMAKLPERCRRIVQLRKIDGWSQKQIADHLGTTEKAIEKQVWLGVRAIREAWSRSEDAVEAPFDARKGGSGR